MKALIRLSIIIFVLSLFSGCSSFTTQRKVYPKDISQASSKINLPVGKSIIYVMQPFEHRVKENVASKIYIDDKYIGSVGNLSYVFAIVSPGKHQIKVKSILPLVGTKKVIYTKADQKYYFTQARLIGSLPSVGCFLFEEDSSNGEKELSKCAFSADCVFANSLK